MTTLLASYSPSAGGKDHQVLLGGDGNTYCSCPAWKFQKLPPSQRTCKHRDDYLAGALSAANVFVVPATSINKAKKVAVRVQAPVVQAPAQSAVVARYVAEKARVERIAVIGAEIAKLSAELSALLAEAAVAPAAAKAA